MADALADRRRGLEDAFFAEQDAALLRRLRQDTDAKQKRETLRSALGIGDDALLDRLAALGLTAETATALSLVPLVSVAWADGHVDAREREAALEAAKGQGIDPSQPGHALLASWLDRKPGPELLAMWKSYLAVLLPTLDPDARAAMRSQLLDRARAVAEAAGGILGLAWAVSPKEQAVLNDLASTLDA